MTYEQLLARIIDLGTHEALGPTGQGLGIEQNPHELATFLASLYTFNTTIDLAMPERYTALVGSVLEIGTGYRAALAQFLHNELNLDVSTIDVNDYGHKFPGVSFFVEPERKAFVRQFDLVIIDAAKDYNNAEADWVHYGAMATKAVAICGIAGLRGADGVAAFWKELAYTKKGVLKKGFFEAIAEDDHRSGIGWLLK